MCAVCTLAPQQDVFVNQLHNKRVSDGIRADWCVSMSPSVAVGRSSSVAVGRSRRENRTATAGRVGRSTTRSAALVCSVCVCADTPQQRTHAVFDDYSANIKIGEDVVSVGALRCALCCRSASRAGRALRRSR